MFKTHTLKLSHGGSDYQFTENEQVLGYLKQLYPSLEFEVALSLSDWARYRNLHTLSVEYPYALDIQFNNPNVSGAVFDSLLNFLDSVIADMYQNGIKRSTVVLSRIDVGTFVDPIALKSKVFAHLRAVFVPNN